MEMLNGEVGIVVESHPRHKLRPKVLMVRDADHVELTPYQHLDLMKAPKDSSGQPYQIAKEVPDGTYGIVLQDFVDQGLIMSAPIPETSDEPWKD
ncbi:hypothetical protein [Marinobacter similis]|uniref:hypothetical protein n=1 Tax=Marinobacter similis TaxID=1420916 RepID=UPI002E80729E|nr:hypothetical protein [Marinobacter similis]